MHPCLFLCCCFNRKYYNERMEKPPAHHTPLETVLKVGHFLLDRHHYEPEQPEYNPLGIDWLEWSKAHGNV